MPVMDPEKKKLAQEAKRRNFKICRRCKKKFRREKDKCPRCGARNTKFKKNIREVHQLNIKRSGARKV